MKKIMIVDDDPHIGELLQLYLEADGYQTVSCEHGDQAVQLFQTTSPDLIILDLMLPGKNGFDLLREFRQLSKVPVIMLTARGDTLDQVVGLELGADDYVKKPFEPKELIARIKAVLRRVSGTLQTQSESGLNTSDDVIRHDRLIVDKNRFTATVNGQEFDMPPKELELLFFLAKNPNRVFTREQLLENIWGFDFYGESRTVDVHIKRIREKLDQVDHPNWQIKTVWGIGYKFELKD